MPKKREFFAVETWNGKTYIGENIRSLMDTLLRNMVLRNYSTVETIKLRMGVCGRFYREKAVAHYNSDLYLQTEPCHLRRRDIRSVLNLS